MITETTETQTLWVCEDCLMAAAGYSDEETGRTPDPEPLHLLGDYGMGNLTTGLMAEEHDTDCPNVDEMGWIGGQECQCETREHSTTWCDGCNTHLNGSRHALTLWGS